PDPLHGDPAYPRHAPPGCAGATGGGRVPYGGRAVRLVGGVPDIGGLSQAQQRGVDCVWCGVTLSAETAVDLGPRPLKILDYRTYWYPRACPRHALPRICAVCDEPVAGEAEVVLGFSSCGARPDSYRHPAGTPGCVRRSGTR
ncbi:hypothetical protein, partial [Streptomyces sp. YS-3]|uniref:hypothetical protein n=1 Tax=Streptomyces sp. YS-3 TaxID=3381352 RepID=UPI0038625987